MEYLELLSRAIDDPQNWTIILHGYDIKTRNLLVTEKEATNYDHPFNKMILRLGYCNIADSTQYDYVFKEKCDITIYRSVAGVGKLPSEDKLFKKRLYGGLLPFGFLLYNDYDFERIIVPEPLEGVSPEIVSALAEDLEHLLKHRLHHLLRLLVIEAATQADAENEALIHLVELARRAGVVGVADPLEQRAPGRQEGLRFSLARSHRLSPTLTEVHWGISQRDPISFNFLMGKTPEAC